MLYGFDEFKKAPSNPCTVGGQVPKSAATSIDLHPRCELLSVVDHVYVCHVHIRYKLSFNVFTHEVSENSLVLGLSRRIRHQHVRARSGS